MDLEAIKARRERHSTMLGQVCHCTECELLLRVEAGTAAGIEMAAEIERLEASVARLEEERDAARVDAAAQRELRVEIARKYSALRNASDRQAITARYAYCLLFRGGLQGLNDDDLKDAMEKDWPSLAPTAATP